MANAVTAAIAAGTVAMDGAMDTVRIAARKLRAAIATPVPQAPAVRVTSIVTDRETAREMPSGKDPATAVAVAVAKAAAVKGVAAKAAAPRDADEETASAVAVTARADRVRHGIASLPWRGPRKRQCRLRSLCRMRPALRAPCPQRLLPSLQHPRR